MLSNWCFSSLFVVSFLLSRHVFTPILPLSSSAVHSVHLLLWVLKHLKLLAWLLVFSMTQCSPSRSWQLCKPTAAEDKSWRVFWTCHGVGVVLPLPDCTTLDIYIYIFTSLNLNSHRRVTIQTIGEIWSSCSLQQVHRLGQSSLQITSIRHIAVNGLRRGTMMTGEEQGGLACF